MKIFEKVVRDKIMTKCRDKINDKQHGFLPGRSCNTQMVPFLWKLAITINDMPIIDFYFSKAFDSGLCKSRHNSPQAKIFI